MPCYMNRHINILELSTTCLLENHRQGPISTERTLDQAGRQTIRSLIPPPQVDLFATAKNSVEFLCIACRTPKGIGCGCNQSRLGYLGNNLLVPSSESDFEGFGEIETIQGDRQPSYPTLACKNLVCGNSQQCQRQCLTSINYLAGHSSRECSNSGVPAKSQIVDSTQSLTGLNVVFPDISSTFQKGQSGQTSLPEEGIFPNIGDNAVSPRLP